MEIGIIAPGIECKVSNAGIATRVACEVLDYIYYKEPDNVMSLHEDNNDPFALIKADRNDDKRSGICINNKFYCFPDAVDVISKLICEHLRS